MEAGGGLVEDEQFWILEFGLKIGAPEELAELEALGLAAGEGVERLAEFEVAEADFDERARGVG